MLLRRITEHIRNQNWIAVSLDLTVVVVGILIGFQLDRLYEAQREKSNEGDYVAALIEDFAINRRTLERAIGVANGSIEAALTLRSETNRQRTELSAEGLNQLFSEVARLPSFEVVRRTYDSLTDSGGLAQLGDSELRRELTEFYTRVELSVLIQNTQELQFVRLLQPYMIENLDYAATTRHRSLTANEASRLDPVTDPELILSALTTIEFQNLLVAEWETAIDLRSEYERLLGHVERIERVLPLAEEN